MPWLHRSAVKSYQTGPFMICIHVKRMPLTKLLTLTKHDSDLKQTLESEETK